MDNGTVADLVLKYPVEKQDDIALIFLDARGKEKCSYTFNQLKQACLSAANAIAGRVNAGEVILLSTEDQANFIACFFGGILAGCVPAPLPPVRGPKDKQGLGRMLRIIKSSRVAHIIADELQKPLIAGALQRENVPSINLHTAEEIVTITATATELPEIDAGSIAYVQYTSGSTSESKGVVLRHKNVMNNVVKMQRVFNRAEPLRLVGWIPFHHDMGLVGHLFSVLYECGQGIFMPAQAFIVSPQVWLDTISHYRANTAAAPTFAFAHCESRAVAHDKLDLSSWKYAYVGSETVALPILDRFYKKFSAAGFSRNTFKPVYGLAEATLLVAGGTRGLDELEQDIIITGNGKQGTRALIPYLIDADDEIIIKDITSDSVCLPGESGQIIISSSSNSDGYLGFEADIPGVVQTGDIGFVKNGNLYITGRLREMVIVRGVNYAAEDLEVSSRHQVKCLRPDDHTICVSVIRNEGERFFVLQEVQRHTPITQLEQIAAAIQANLSGSWGITAYDIVLIPAGLIPRTGNYKISRTESINRYLAGDIPLLYALNEKKESLPADEENDPVVIVGMACRFPGGADTPQKFWELLESGTDAISTVPPERWDNSLFYDERPATPGKVNTQWAGFIDGIDQFDATLFDISAYEAPELDPQQRLLMETSWRLLENAGIKKSALEGSDTGVFIGMSTNDYLYMKIKLSPGMEGFNAYSGLGNSNSVAANRLSYFYDFKGPSLTVDTACSSSLTAFHLAAEAIRNGSCSQAIAGGVNAILSPGPTITLSQFGMMAPDGRCKTFDESADGYVRAEGCGMVMLKRKSQAEKDGNAILAVVCASTIAQDGRSPGITFPNGKAQYRLIAETLHKAGLQGGDIGYVEAHGTGTPSGDPVEMEQLGRLYGEGSGAPCYVGSVKASIGHLEAGAGIASVIKAVLMLQKDIIPPQLHVCNINPRIRLAGTRLNISSSALPWDSGPKRIAISSFGFGGSLAHAILAKPAQEKKQQAQPTPFAYAQRSFIFSAATAAGLTRQAEHISGWLSANQVLSIDDITYTQATCRSDLKYRKALMVSSAMTLNDKLDEFVASGGRVPTPQPPAGICFLFTGQGEHYIYMGKMLYQRFPIFKAAFDRCAAAVADQMDEVSLGEMAFTIKDVYFLEDKYMQPVLFAIQYALGTLWQACGVYPDYMIGHSLGEYAAACLSGCFEPETGMRILMKRAALVDALEKKGMMVTLFTGHELIREVMDAGRMQIAAINSPKKTVISGEEDALVAVMNHFEGVEYYHLKTSNAFHSQLMQPIAAEFGRFMEQFEFKKPGKTWVSALRGQEMTEAPDAAYWVEHLLGTVDFKTAVDQLPADSPLHFIEIGPGASTLVAVTENRSVKDVLMLRSLNFRKEERTEDYFFFDSLGRLYEAGLDIKWEAVLNGNPAPQVWPGQQLMQQRYWMNGITAERLAEFANPQNISTSAIKPPVITGNADIHHLVWKNSGFAAMPAAADIVDTNWIIIGEDAGLTDELSGMIKRHGGKAYFIHVGKAPNKSKSEFNVLFDDRVEKWISIFDKIVYQKSREDARNWRVIYLTPTGTGKGKAAENELHERRISAGTGMLIPILQALKKNALVLPVWLITSCSQVSGDEPGEVNLSHAAVWGFGKTIFLEHPELRGGMIDIAEDTLSAHVLAKICQPQNERVVALRNGCQYIQYIAPREKINALPSLSLRDDGVFIITGGLGGLGLKCTEWVVKCGGRRLILISRKQFPAMAEWESLRENHSQYKTAMQLLQLKEQGADIEILSLDVRDAEGISAMFARLDKNGVPVRGIIHAAGLNWFGKVMDLDRKEFEDTLKIKVSASWALHNHSLNRDLDCFILFSSVSALWGSVELSHYTAANHFMDILSHVRQKAGLPSLSINWGPWAEAGMSAEERESTILQKLGFSLMKPVNALEAMQKLVNAKTALSLVANIDWERFGTFIDFSLQPSLFELVRPKATVTAAATSGVNHIHNSEPGEARRMVEEAVRMKLRNVMLLESSERVDHEQRFNFLGMDSLMSISFATELEHYFGIKLPNTLAYNYPTIKAVSDYIYNQVYTGKEHSENTQPEKKAQIPAEKTPSKTDFKLYRPISTPKANVKCTVFCFPYIGAGASIYEKWAKNFAGDINVVAVQPPGREELSEVEPFKSMPELIACLAGEFICPEGEFVFFGHSFGGLMAYELYQALKLRGQKTPHRLILSGCGAPLSASGTRLHELPESQFIDAIIEKYNNNKQVDDRKQALLMNATPLRADVQMLELYEPESLPVQVPLTVIAGHHDELAPPLSVKNWASLAESDFSIFYLDCGHEMIDKNGAEVAAIVNRNL